MPAMGASAPSRSLAFWSHGAGCRPPSRSTSTATQRNLDAAEVALAPWLAKDPADQEARDLAIDLVAGAGGAAVLAGQISGGDRGCPREGLALEAAVTPTDPDARREALRRACAAARRACGEHLLHGRLARRGSQVSRAVQAWRASLRRRSPELSLRSAFTRARGWALGGTLLEMGPNRQAEAEQLLSEVTTADRQPEGVLEPDDKDLLADALGDRCRRRRRRSPAIGRAEEAVPLMEEAVRQRSALWNEASGDWAIARDVATSLDMFGGRAASVRARPKRACVAYQESLDVFAQMRAAGRSTPLDKDTIQKEVREAFTKNCAGKATALAR